MRIGVPKEIKPQENRIGLTPESVKALVSEGHEVLVENNGGFEAGFDNDQYKSVGAKIINKAEDESGQKLFAEGDKPSLRREIPLSVLLELMSKMQELGEEVSPDAVKSTTW